MLANVPHKLAVIGLMVFAALLWFGTTPSVIADPTCADPPEANESQDATCVNTKAVVDGTGLLPEVQNVFSLPDMDPMLSGIQFTDSKEGGELCVTNPTTGLITNTPCIDPETGQDVPDKQTGAYAHNHHDGDPAKPGQTVARPNLDDKPEKRQIAVFAVISDPNGPDDIETAQVTVRYPDGTKKTTLTMLKGHCDDLGLRTNVSAPVHAALNIGKWGHTKDCSKTETVWRVDIAINNDQPPGKYQVCVKGTDGKGSGAPLCNTIDVPNTLGFEIDFNMLDFGLISPGVRKPIAGNVTMDPMGAAPPVAPTIQNTGNSPFCLSVHSTAMVGKETQDLTPIVNFAASMNHVEVKYKASETVQIPEALASKAIAQLDFAIDPPGTMGSDTYQGQTDLSVKKPNTTVCGTD